MTRGPSRGQLLVESGLSDKDRAENVMIVDLIRNDLSWICEPGSVEVPHLLRVETHPGLVYLVSYVSGAVIPGTSWLEVFAATFPPGSVSGAPKLAALSVIGELEQVPRVLLPFGWIDVDAGTAELAVAIRLFWVCDGTVRFGTGAGITWGSDANAEWAETEPKARRLIRLASAPGMPSP